MGKKEDDAADFLENLLSGGAKFVDIDDDNQNLIDRFNSTVDASNVKLDADIEREYQEYIKNSTKDGHPAISRAEFLAIINAMAKSPKGK